MNELGGTGVVAGVSLSIQIIHDRREVRLVPIGEIDVHSAATFAIAGDLAVDEMPERMQLDLSQVTFMDSSGVRGIESVMARAAEFGVECSIIGRNFELGDSEDASRPMVVWSGSTTRRIAVPKD